MLQCVGNFNPLLPPIGCFKTLKLFAASANNSFLLVKIRFTALLEKCNVYADNIYHFVSLHYINLLAIAFCIASF